MGEVGVYLEGIGECKKYLRELNRDKSNYFRIWLHYEWGLLLIIFYLFSIVMMRIGINTLGTTPGIPIDSLHGMTKAGIIMLLAMPGFLGASVLLTNEMVEDLRYVQASYSLLLHLSETKAKVLGHSGNIVYYSTSSSNDIEEIYLPIESKDLNKQYRHTLNVLRRSIKVNSLENGG